MQDIEEWNENIEAWIKSSERHSLLLTARVAGIMSILGAGYIIQDIVKDPARRTVTRNRIMVVMSTCDLLDALVHAVLAPFLVPKETGIPEAMGNELTCTIQGFFSFVVATTSPCLNVSLAICYTLMLHNQFSEDRLQKFDHYFLLLPMAYFLVGITGLPFNIYNFYGSYTCFIRASPLYCDKPESPVECERGEFYMYWYYLNGAVVTLFTVIIIFCMNRMYTTALQNEQLSSHQSPPYSSRNLSSCICWRSERHHVQEGNISRMLREQGLWYSGAFIVTFIPPTIFTLWETYWTHFFCVVTFHLVGFTNALIYIRPRFIRFRRDFPALGCGSSLWYTLTRKNPPNTNSIANESTMISSAEAPISDVVLENKQQRSMTSSLVPVASRDVAHSSEEE